MKRIVTTLICILFLASVSYASGIFPKEKFKIVEQLSVTLNTTAKDILNDPVSDLTIPGFLSISVSTDILANLVCTGATDNYLPLYYPGRDLDSFYTERNSIYAKTSTGNTTIYITVRQYVE